MSLFMKVDIGSIKNIDFGSWLIGFTEGEGSFTSDNGRPRFFLSQSDLIPLLYVRDFFGIGHIYYKNRDSSWVYSVSGKKCWVIRQFCEDNLLIKKKIDQFERWKSLRWLEFDDKIIPQRQTTNFSDWLLGFIEAEGSFTVSQRKYPEFSLAQMHERDIFERIKEFFGGVGNIRKTHRKGGWQYTASNTQCWAMRDFCEGKLISRRKTKQFEAWKDLIWTQKKSGRGGRGQ